MNTKMKSRYPEARLGLGLPVIIQIAWVLIIAVAIMVMSACTIVLSAEVGGTSSGTGGVLDPMLAIFEEELLAAFDASRSMAGVPSDEVGDLPARGIGETATRGLAGGVNSIKHGLPSTTVAQVRARVRETIVAQGLEKSRDLEKVAPAIASAAAEALADSELVGTEVTTADLSDINAITAKAVARGLNAPSVTGLAEGLGTEIEKQARLDALARAAAANVDTLALPAADAADSLQMVVWLVTAAGNTDVSSTGTGDNDPGTLLTARTGSLVRIVGAKLDGRLTGTLCSDALNDLANAAVVGLGDTAIRDLADTKLQPVVQDGVLFNLFMAYYGFKQDVGLSATELRGAIDFGEAITAIGTSEFATAVADEIQAERTIIVPAADTKARTAAIITTTNPPINEIAGATVALALGTGSSATWTRGSAIRVVSNLAVNGNLIIEPGITVYVDFGCPITVGVDGSISAVGTMDEPITFTRSVSGSAWGSLEISSNSPMNHLAYCNVSGATNGIIIAHYSTNQGIAVIDNCIVRDNQRHGIYAEFARRDGTRMTTIRNCYMYGNLVGQLVINESVALDSEAPNYFHDPLSADGPDPADPANRIKFLGNITLPVTLGSTEVPYFIPDSTLLDVGAKLEILDGVTLVFGSESYLRVNAGGSLHADGTEAAPVVFTGTEKISGYWRGLQFHDSNSVDNLLDHVIIEYAGGGGVLSYAEARANLVLTKNTSTSRIRISNTTLRHSSRYGLYVDPSLAIDLFEANTCTANAAGAVYIDANSVHLLGNDSDYSGNTIDVIAIDETTITASQNWKDLGVPFRQVSVDGRIEITSGANLTLDPGVTIEFAQGARLYINGTGSLSVIGTSENPVILTGQQKQSGYWRVSVFTIPCPCRISCHIPP